MGLFSSTLLVLFVVTSSGFLSAVSAAASTDGTDVVIVSNNDLDPLNYNRASVILLKDNFTCIEAQGACEGLQESLIQAPTPNGLNADGLSLYLTSPRHGAQLPASQQLWISGINGSCSVFQSNQDSNAVSSSSDSSQRLPALCTNAAYLTRSNITLPNTDFTIDVPTANAGILTGFRDKFSFRFLGVKYAQPTGGQGRFQPPEALQVSADTQRSALEYGPMCAQVPDADNGHQLYTSEDCLSLNVYTPVVHVDKTGEGSPAKLPVMFFIHGGGLNTGDSGPFPYNMTTSGFVGNSTANIYDGTNLVSFGGVVLVTINYRLNAFGFFNGSNAAFHDVLLALSWVQDNIGAFGGDKSRVMVFGESAGGSMTRFLLGANPKHTQGLLSAAAVLSDFPTSYPFLTSEESMDRSLTLAKALDCEPCSTTTLTDTGYSCVTQKSASDIVNASLKANIQWSITIDGDYILGNIEDSIKDGNYTKVPTIWSNTVCEFCYFIPSSIPPDSPPSTFPGDVAMFFNDTDTRTVLKRPDLYPYQTALSKDGISGSVITLADLLTDYYVHCPSSYLASLETNATKGQTKVYKADFSVGLGSPLTPNPSTCTGQVCHADDLYLVFATAETDNLYQPMSLDQVHLMQEVVSRWTELAWTGTPNYEGAPAQWDPFVGDNDYVVGANYSYAVQPYRKAQCDFVTAQLGFVF
ncbi:alpha beta-hydrolase [Gyrodon lividus]|nr:alpha beta-hydrolase [Gyrodon lividus]